MSIRIIAKLYRLGEQTLVGAVKPCIVHAAGKPCPRCADTGIQFLPDGPGLGQPLEPGDTVSFHYLHE
jgi:hypothetical protein